MTTKPKFADVPFSLAHLSEIDVAPVELLEASRAAGISSIGVRLAPASPGGLAYSLATATEQTAVRQKVEQTGVSVLYIELISLSATTRAVDHLAMMETGAAIGASRICVAGDSADIALMTDKFGVICEAARPFGLAVDLEFMPFRAVTDLAMAAKIVAAADQPNGHILVDALHVYRSHSSLDLLRSLDRKLLGTFQLCDAPAVAPPADQLIGEARTRRLSPGEGGLDLRALIDALPSDIPVGIEVPTAAAYPALSPAQRLTRVVQASRAYLSETP
jgi:sugar phosphate isomerase/epimerase